MRYRERNALRRRAAASSAPLAAALLAGCAVGPDFEKPAAPPVASVARETPTTTAATTGVPGGAAQTFTAGRDIPGEWWTLFRSPQLTALVEQSLKGNPNIDAAHAALRQANDL